MQGYSLHAVESSSSDEEPQATREGLHPGCVRSQAAAFGGGCIRSVRPLRYSMFKEPASLVFPALPQSGSIIVAIPSKAGG